jgi:hypothetical protein
MTEETTFSGITIVMIAHNRPDTNFCMHFGKEFQGWLIITIPGYIVAGQKDDIRLKRIQDIEDLLFALPQCAYMQISELNYNSAVHYSCQMIVPNPYVMDSDLIRLDQGPIKNQTGRQKESSEERQQLCSLLHALISQQVS